MVELGEVIEHRFRDLEIGDDEVGFFLWFAVFIQRDGDVGDRKSAVVVAFWRMTQRHAREMAGGGDAGLSLVERGEVAGFERGDVVGIGEGVEFVHFLFLIEPTAVRFAVGRLSDGSPAERASEEDDHESFDGPDDRERDAADGRVSAEQLADSPGAIFVEDFHDFEEL